MCNIDFLIYLNRKAPCLIFSVVVFVIKKACNKRLLRAMRVPNKLLFVPSLEHCFFFFVLHYEEYS